MQNTNQKAVVKMARTLDTDQLVQRQQEARQKLLEGFYNGYQWVYPCADLHSFQGFDLALEYTQQSVKQGKEIYQHDPATNSGYYYAVSFWKSPEDIQAILEASDLEVEQKLIIEVEEHNKQQISLLADQLYQAQKNKEEKVQREKEDKAKAKALEEAQAFISSQIAGSK